MSNYYVGFEGPIGAGKTTLATLFSQHAQWDLILESFDENEFLADFYSDQFRWALPMQLSFLAARHEQLATGTLRRNQRSLVADYTYAKDEMFARLLLKQSVPDELRRTTATPALAAASLPDLVVFLDAPNEVLLERIRLRGRGYEAAIDGEYLDNLRKAYRNELLSRAGLRFVEVDTSTLDLEASQQMNELWTRILSAIDVPIRAT